MVPTSSRPLQKYLQLPRTIVNLTRLVNFPDLFHPTNSLHFASSYICLIHTNTLPNNFSQSIHLRLGLPRNLMPGNSLYYNLFTTFASFLMTIPLKFTLFYTHSGSFSHHTNFALPHSLPDHSSLYHKHVSKSSMPQLSF